MSRWLVLGDPVVSLGEQTLIPDGALIIEDQLITAAGPREQLERQGPFDRVLGSPGHLVMPGFVNCHYHSELIIGPGLYQHVFEKANVHIQAATGPISEADLYYGILWGLITAIKGGQTGTVDMYYGRPSLPDFGCDGPARLRRRRAAHGVRAGEPGPEHLRARERRAVPGPAAARPGRRGAPVADGLRLAGG